MQYVYEAHLRVDLPGVAERCWLPEMPHPDGNHNQQRREQAMNKAVDKEQS
jgi:hypothetical protein